MPVQAAPLEAAPLETSEGISNESVRIIQELTQKGYPLPAVLNDASLAAEAERIRALEAYASEVMFASP